eukprot:13465004-Alexandrium_andersonii.AAC.1
MCSKRRRTRTSRIALRIASPPFPVANSKRDRIAPESRDPANGVARSSLPGLWLLWRLGPPSSPQGV